jgi:hypothetical protein
MTREEWLTEVAQDLQNQRDARDEENRRLRAHVSALLRALEGKAKRKEITHIVIAAHRELEQPLRAAPDGKTIPLYGTAPNESEEH